MDGSSDRSRRRWFTLIALIISGEMIFSLPFHLPRYFRPSVLDSFNLSNANLGDVFAIYGVTAMLAYFPGGMLADRIAPRKLMAASLVATALGGIYLVTLPGHLGLSLLYGYWGVTTIFLFWAAMIRATREWGGESSQGQAFGLLEGGRGLAAAAFASGAVFCFAQFVGDADASAARDLGIRAVIIYYSLATALAAALVFFLLGDSPAASVQPMGSPFQGVRAVLAKPLVWMQAAIVICAYCGYKGLDNYSLYAYEVLGMSELASASFTAKAAYIRPVAALAAGLIADRVGASRSLSWLFAVLVLAYGALALLEPQAQLISLIYANIFVTFVAVFALRAVYFAVMEEISVPGHMTGTAVGLVSVVGYTPDIFFAPIAGRLLDATPGLGGHQNYFLFLAAIAATGLITAIMMLRRASRRAISGDAYE